MKKQQTKGWEHNKIVRMTVTALFIAITYIATRFINITLPIPAAGGLIHLGNVPVYVAAILFGKRTGAIAGSFGMALFDLTSGWTIWAPFTFAIVWIEGYVVGSIANKRKDFTSIVAALLAALVIKCTGYYFAEVILYQNFITPLYSIIANIMQVIAAGAFTLVFVPSLRQIRTMLIME